MGEICINLVGSISVSNNRECATDPKGEIAVEMEAQFQFAGYYAAIEKGFYKQVGIEVDLIEASEGLTQVML